MCVIMSFINALMDVLRYYFGFACVGVGLCGWFGS